ncbi:MAG: putative lipid II flippase FtsW [Elusimicrobiota bacterium]
MGRGSRRAKIPDYNLLALSLVLLCFGWIMLFSASAILADQQFGDALYYVKRQAVWTILGLAGMAVFTRLHYNRLREWVWPLLALTLVVLVGVLFCPPVAGVRRWIRIGPLGFQPAEFAKLTTIVFLADYLDRKRSKMSNPMQGIVVPWSVVGLLFLLIGLEPDLGTPVLLFMVGVLLLFIGGTRMRHLAWAFVAAVPVLIFELLRKPYRRQRLFSFLDPFGDATGSGYQLVQSLLAVGSGGWLGVGLGASKLKLLYLPTPHTDFIFPVICEELGFLGALAVIGIFTAFLLRGIRVARNAPDLFGTLLACGLTFLICLQAFFNIAMSIGLLPTKGLPLPFFSYGGSSMLVTLAAVGILLNISRHSTEPVAIRRR